MHFLSLSFLYLTSQPKMKREMVEVKELTERIEREAPARGSKPSESTKFTDLPLSSYTQSALKMANFTTMTEIQQASLPHALAGRDILGAAKTGSGKTLAFLIPVIERLYRERWDQSDGLGALVISPIRELALQIFEVLRTVGKYHDLAAGLITGGKDFKAEQSRVAKMNILICTPGRLLQHLESSFGLDASHVKMLVLDEADRILDMGFERDLKAILEYIKSEDRQTLLFSATQTKNVRDLARLNLRDPEYIGVHDKSEFATPKELSQSVVTVELHDKLDTLFSFIKSHLKHKVLIFVSTAKEVRYLYELFCKLRPGVPLMAVHGRMKQNQRMIAYYEFLEKAAAVMFCTDIAARGLDWPGIDWVVQYDCPEDVATYIHRVGRTARYQSGGNAMMMLLPSERAFLPLLGAAKIPIEETAINPVRSQNIRRQVQAIVAESVEIKHLAQRAFISYIRSIHLSANKEVHNTASLALDQYAESLGLAIVPKVKLPETEKEAKALKNVNHKLNSLKEKIKAAKLEKKQKLEDERRARLKAERGGSSESESSSDSDSKGEDSDDELLQYKGAYEEPGAVEEEPLPQPVASKKKKIVMNKGKKIEFDDEGNAPLPLSLQSLAKSKASPTGEPLSYHSMEGVEEYQRRVASRLNDAAAVDKESEKDRLKAKRLKLKLKHQPEKKEQSMAVLASSSEDGGESESEGGGDSGEEDHSDSGSDDSGSDGPSTLEAKALALLNKRR
jgi:ATP-dependent RNA helicase DDX10/DBP4